MTFGDHEVQFIDSAEDFANIKFVNDVAEIEVPIKCLGLLPLKNDDRSDGERLRAVERAIRHNGYNNLHPVVARLGRRGRWVVVDGGHRLTAARNVSREFFTNLFGAKVRNIHFVLYRTPISNTRLDTPDTGNAGDGGDT